MQRILKIRSAALAALLLILASHVEMAQAAERSWQLQVSGVLLDSDLTEEGLSDDGLQVRAEVGDATGFSVGTEVRLSDRFGLALETTFAEPDFDVHFELADGTSLRFTDGLSVIPITAGARFHLTPNRAVDVFLGVDLSYVIYSDFTLRSEAELSADFSSDDDLAWGARLGLAAPFRDGPWSFLASLQYLDSTLEVTDLEDDEVTKLGFDPLLLRLGFAYRF